MYDRDVKPISFLDNLLFNLFQVIPYYTQGIFTRRQTWVGLWTRIHPDPLGVKFISYLRRKYRSQYLGIRLLTEKSILILDIDGVKQVLDNSPTVYAEPRSKQKGMAHFQPSALTISRGEEWRDRRRFNVAILDGKTRLHPFAEHFLEIIQQEVDIIRRRSGGHLIWDDLQDLFEKITLQIIFGTGARDDEVLLENLNSMMRESNRLFALRKSKHFDTFYERIRRYLQDPQEMSLVAISCQVSSSEVTKVENQIPHWIFAMNETLAINTARALALITARPQVAAQVREEMAAADLSSAKGIERLTYLEGCLQEAMRLWPTTPMLMREAVSACQVGPVAVLPETQLIIHNGFNHRDRKAYPQADSFMPELWPELQANYRFNHFSHGPQACAGYGLALLIGKAVLATLFNQDKYVLLKPSLDPDVPVPQALNHFALKFSRTPLS